MSTLVGADDLKARFKALQTKVIVPAGKAWAEEAAQIARSRVGSMNMPYSGQQAHRAKPQTSLLPSITVKKSRSKQKFVVVGSYHAYFVDAGVKPHSLQRRAASRTIFAPAARKQHPGYRARRFRGPAASGALAKHPVSETVVKAWNEAA